jgi:hypothetical protein
VTQLPGWLPDWLEGRVSVTVAEAMTLFPLSESTAERMMRENVLVWSQPLGPRTQRYITVASLLVAFGVPTSDTADTTEDAEGE